MNRSRSATVLVAAGLLAGSAYLCWRASRAAGTWLAEVTALMDQGVIPDLPGGE